MMPNTTFDNISHYALIDSTQKYNFNRNYILHYTRDLRCISCKEVLDDGPREKDTHAKTLGPEDGRLICRQENTESWFVTATVYDNDASIPAKVAYFELEEAKDFFHIRNFVRLVAQGVPVMRKERNWLPFVRGNSLFVIYSLDPFSVYKVNTHTGECICSLKYSPNKFFENFCGSAPPIAFESGYLLLVHEKIHNKIGRSYVHRFVYLNQDLVIQKVSRPFSMKSFEVEFSCGMTIDHAGENLLIGLGVEDKEAYIASVDLQTVRRLLRPL
jgi:hypothetical protein